MPTIITKEELQERAQLVRVWEAACGLEYPTKDEANFRIAVAKKLATYYGLRELRTAAFEGPVVANAQPPRPEMGPTPGAKRGVKV